MKLITIKNREFGRISRVPQSLLNAMRKVAKDAGINCVHVPVPKKLWKRKQRDLQKVRSKKQPNTPYSGVDRRLAKIHGSKN